MSKKDLANITDLNELLDALDADEETMATLLTFLEEVNERRNCIANATSIEELQVAIAAGVFNPVVTAANGTVRESVGPVLSVLLGVDENSVAEDIAIAVSTASFDCSVEDISAAAVVRELDKMIVDGSLDEDNSNHVRAALHDIAKRRQEGLVLVDMPEALRVKAGGFFKLVKSAMKDARGHADILRSMTKQCRSLSDIEVWFSRYLLNHPLKAAKENDYLPLQRVSTMSNKEILAELVDCAQMCGYTDVSGEHFDLNNVYDSIYAFCNARTGYKSPREYYAMLLSKRVKEVMEAQAQ